MKLEKSELGVICTYTAHTDNRLQIPRTYENYLSESNYSNKIK